MEYDDYRRKGKGYIVWRNIVIQKKNAVLKFKRPNELDIGFVEKTFFLCKWKRVVLSLVAMVIIEIVVYGYNVLLLEFKSCY